MDRAHTSYGYEQACQNSTNLDTGRKTQKRKTEGDLEEDSRERTQRTGFQIMGWADASRVAKERTEWRGVVSGPILHRERRK